nr:MULTISPECIES: GNAT family N-acetyltransferase [unclassified Methanobrevibacter]
MTMKNYDSIFSAWDGEDLVGVVCVMDDGLINAYVHYLLVKPEYRLKGIGKQLAERVKNHYKDYLHIVIIANDSELRFYEYCGFEKLQNSTPMHVINR